MPQQQSMRTAQALRELILTVMRTAPQTSLSRTAAGTLSRLERLGPQRITALADAEAVTQPAMTGLVQRLEAAGLVKREPDDADRRATRIAITRPGHTALQERRRRHDEAIAARIEALDPGQCALLHAALPAIKSMTENE